MTKLPSKLRVSVKVNDDPSKQEQAAFYLGFTRAVSGTTLGETICGTFVGTKRETRDEVKETGERTPAKLGATRISYSGVKAGGSLLQPVLLS